MKVNGSDYRTVWMEGGTIFFIEQNLLPFRFEIGSSPSFRESCDVISTMAVRGAGAIGAMAGFAMAQAFLESEKYGTNDLPGKARLMIESTRPTARNLFHAVDKVFEAGQRSASDAVKTAGALADKDADDSRRIGEYGATLIYDGMGILTHCNAGWLAFVDYGTALSPIYNAFSSGKNIFIYVDETRPRNQGARLTAWELGNAGIPHAIIPDSAGAFYMSKRSIQMVITGADRIALNGDVANKIGTLEKAIVAKEYNIPFYVAAPFSTFDKECPSGAEIVIEERNELEVLMQSGIDESGDTHEVRVSAPGSHALNPAFDVTPASFITGIITEIGIIKPSSETIKNILTNHTT